VFVEIQVFNSNLPNLRFNQNVAEARFQEAGEVESEC
jgi:hypothetical protein